MLQRLEEPAQLRMVVMVVLLLEVWVRRHSVLVEEALRVYWVLMIFSSSSPDLNRRY